MAVTIQSFRVLDENLNANETTTLELIYSSPVLTLELDDFRLEGVELSDLQTSDGGKSWTATVTPLADYKGSGQILVNGDGYFAADDYSPGVTRTLEFAVDTRETPSPEITFEDAGADGIYNIEEVGEDGTITANITVPAGTLTGQTLTVNGQDYPVTLDIRDNGLNLEILPGEEITASLTDRLGNQSTETIATASEADTDAPDAPTIGFEPTGDDDVYNADEVGDDGTITATVTVPEGTEIGETLTINGQVYSVTQDIIDNGQAVEIEPGTQVTANLTDAAGNAGLEANETAPVADTDVPDDITTQLVIDDVTEDNIINATEVGQTIAVMGTVSGEFTEGDIVTLIVNGNGQSGAVDADGNFNIDVPGSDLAADSDTTIDGSVVATDGAGNTDTIEAIKAYSVDIDAPDAPTIGFESTGDDDVYNADEVGDDGTITATVTVPDGIEVGGTLTINGQDYPVTQDVLDNGQAVEILPGSKVTANVTDAAGNLGPDAKDTAPQADTNGPNPCTTTLVIGDITEDNVINAAEAGQNIAIIGTVSGEFTDGDIVTLKVNGNEQSGSVDADGNFSIEVAGSDLAADPDSLLEGSISATDASGNIGTVNTNKDYTVDTDAPTASLNIDDITPDNVLQAAELEETITVTGTVSGEFTAGDQVNLTINDIDYTTTLDTNGRFGVDVLGAELAADADTRVAGTVVVTDDAGNQSTATDAQDYTLQLEAAPIFLYHLGYDLTLVDGPYNKCGKEGKEINYLTTTINDEIYIGFKGFDEQSNLIKSRHDGDFERDAYDGDVVWEMNTDAGNDLVYVREDQNAYTVTKLGSGDDTYYIGGALDAHLHLAQYDGDARAYVFGEDGDDTVVIGGNGEGRVTGWGIDGGRIFTGSGSDDVTIYGEMDDGGVIDLGSGNTQYANGYSEATDPDSVNDVNHLNITKNLGDLGKTDFGLIQGGDGQDHVVIGGAVNGHSQVDLGDNDNSLTAYKLQHRTQVTMGEGNDTLSIREDIDDYASVNLGHGNNVIAVAEDIEDYAQIITGDGNDTIDVSRFIENGSTVSTGAGNDSLTTQGINNRAEVDMGEGDDSLLIYSEFGIGGGSASVNMGEGNDVITFGGIRLDGVIDGGIGEDELVLTSESSRSLISSDIFNSIETITLKGKVDLDINYEDLVSDSSRDGALFINGTDNNRVDIDLDTSDGPWLNSADTSKWDKSGSQEVDGTTYDIYHHTNAGNNYGNDLYIEQGVAII